MAERRRAQLRQLAFDGRHQRDRRHALALDLGRSQTLPDRLQAVPLRADAAFEHPVADVPVLFPEHCADAWVWED